MKRSCGSCSLCCKVMGVPEVKQRHDWCPHARPGAGGCAIYQHRPERCREFHCLWLTMPSFGERWFPAKAKIVVDARQEGDRSLVCFIVDPDYPTRWQERPYIDDIEHTAKAGLNGRLGKHWETLVIVKDRILVYGLGSGGYEWCETGATGSDRELAPGQAQGLVLT
jgi:hypothetical protein